MVVLVGIAKYFAAIAATFLAILRLSRATCFGNGIFCLVIEAERLSRVNAFAFALSSLFDCSLLRTANAKVKWFPLRTSSHRESPHHSKARHIQAMDFTRTSISTDLWAGVITKIRPELKRRQIPMQVSLIC